MDTLAGHSSHDGFAALLASDLALVEREISALPRPSDLVGSSAAHLLGASGKKLRPMCVALAARVGRGFVPAAQALAVAVELVHNATLLHDDVVDEGEIRRGAPAARMLYGNAASVFAGDWLLIEALRRVAGAGVPGVLEALLATIDTMIAGEALQLEHRGRLDVGRADYFRIVEAKTASLFRFALCAGAKAGGVSDADTARLDRFGLHFGRAFQLADDALDLSGDFATAKKSLCADLKEGKATFPMLIAMERDPALRALWVTALEHEDETSLLAVRAALERTGALERTRALATEEAGAARAALAELPSGPGRMGLELVSELALAQMEGGGRS